MCLLVFSRCVFWGKDDRFQLRHIEFEARQSCRSQVKAAGLNILIHPHCQCSWFSVLLPKAQVMLELKTRVEELKMENEYQLRLKDMNYSEKIKELTDKFIQEMESLKTKNQVCLKDWPTSANNKKFPLSRQDWHILPKLCSNSKICENVQF